EDGGGGGHYTEHPDASPPKPGQGFWVISRLGKSIAFGGKSTRLDQDYEILLHEDWNLIANPFAFPVSWDDIGQPAGISIPATWNGDYVYPTVLQPRVGYWVLNSSGEGAVLTVPPTGAGKVSGKSDERSYTEMSLDDPGWSVLASAHAGEYADSVNRLGIRDEASAEKDWCDYLDPPTPPGNHISLSFVDQEGRRFLTDFRSLGSSGETWKLLLSSNLTGTDFEVALTLERPLPEDWRLHAIDVSDLTETDLLAQSTIRGMIDSRIYTRSWYIVAGSAAYMEGVRQEAEEEFEHGVTTFSLGQIYPNPFESTAGAVVRLAVPRPTIGNVRVYDVRGRLVRELYSGNIRRGHLRFVWYGRDDSGQRLASGIYFVRMTHGDEQQIRKVVLLR
ncbi:MAG: T9SS type A sorting domain-containing protein, partial [bacterium]